MTNYCCDQFKALEEMDPSLRHDDRGWILVTDEATEVILDYCPFCGRHIGIDEDSFTSENCDRKQRQFMNDLDRVFGVKQ